jgi:(4S)-4-hydroxy-5-phosphonooxypentane-2,3-dione isomerase
MFIAHVHVHVKPENIDEFIEATIENASNSLQEHGVARFDVIQQTDDPAHFVLVEVYRTPNDAATHKETAHYKTWRDTVEKMMAEPRTSIKYENLFPYDEAWEKTIA